MKLTKQRQEILTYIQNYTQRHDHPPTLCTIGEAFGFTRQAAQYHTAALKRAGYDIGLRGAMKYGDNHLYRVLAAIDSGHNTLRAICSKCGIPSTSVAGYLIEALITRGWVTKVTRRARTTRLTDTGQAALQDHYGVVDRGEIVSNGSRWRMYTFCNTNGSKTGPGSK